MTNQQYDLASKYRKDKDANARMTAVRLMRYGIVPFEWIVDAILDENPSVAFIGRTLLYDGANAEKYLMKALTSIDDNRLYSAAVEAVEYIRRKNGWCK